MPTIRARDWVVKGLGSEAATIAVLAVIASAALLKILDFEPFVSLVATTKLVPKGLEFATALALVGLEVLAVIAITAGLNRLSSALCAFLGSGIVLFGGWRLGSHYAGSCHCFGDLLEITASQSIALGILILAVAIRQWLGPRRSIRLDVRIPALLIVLSGAYGLYFLMTPNPQADAPRGVAGISIDPSSGKVEKDGYGRYLVSFTLVNDNDDAVEVKANPSCGCIKGSWSSTRLKPHSKTPYIASGPMPEFVLFRVSSRQPAYLYGKPHQEF